MNELSKYLKPELINRMSEIILFHPLHPLQLSKIVQLVLKNIESRLSSRRITLAMSDEACQMILDAAYDPQFGARPLKRYLDKVLTSELSKLILKGEVVENASLIITTRSQVESQKWFAIPETELVIQELGPQINSNAMEL